MLVNIGFLNAENNIHIKSLNYSTQIVDNKVIKAGEIPNEEFNMLFFDQQTNFEPYAKVLESEEKIYPILDIASVDLDQEEFLSLDFNRSSAIFSKVLSRWILTKNMITIENLYDHVLELKTLWTKNRDKFFEKLWYLLKQNLGTIDLRIIFHDLKDVTPEQAEKGEKPKLIHSFLEGKKSPKYQTGTEIEDKLMQDYKKDFASELNITEYDSDSGNLVMCATIDKSPILIMAKVKNFNQLQRSVIHSIFNGLNDVKSQNL